jgi:hypothetical protein
MSKLLETPIENENVYAISVEKDHYHGNDSTPRLKRN